MRRYPVLLLTLGLILLAGLPAKQSSTDLTVQADTATLDGPSAVPLDNDVLLMACPEHPSTWTPPPSCPANTHPSVWVRDRSIHPTLARAPPRLRAA